MQIQVNEQGVVTGWATLGGFEGGIEVSSLPEDMAPGKYLYADGQFTANPAYAPPAMTEAARQQIDELKSKLAATDYKAMKYAEGFFTEEEYAAIKAQRQAWRDEINQLEETGNAGGPAEI